MENPIDKPEQHLTCSKLNFVQFCKIPFKDEIPQFIQSLFSALTNEDLRKLVGPIAKDTKISKQINDQIVKQYTRKETRKALLRSQLGRAERPPKVEY